MAIATVKSAKESAQVFVPREHGATAMLLTPFFAAAILLRRASWLEIVALIAIVCAFAIKDPLVVIARQRFVWKNMHPETRAAKRSAVAESLLLAACGVLLMLFRDWRPFLLLFLGAGTFTVLAVTLNVRNRQRSEWFQVASAVELSATCLAACLSAQGLVPGWCGLLWFLCALQATTGIFVVHSRLDARIAARKDLPVAIANGRAAFLCLAVLVVVATVFLFVARFWIAGALLLAAVGYFAELRRQTNPESLKMPLKRVGLEALGLSIAYALMVVIGLWNA